MRAVHTPFALAALALLSCCGEKSAPSAPQETGEPSPAAAQPAQISGSFLPASFRAAGTEPFWSATVRGGELTWATPEDHADGAQGKGTTVPVTRSDAPDAVTLTAKIGESPLTLVVTRAQCSDGMSDKISPWGVERRLGDELGAGCAEPLEP